MKLPKIAMRPAGKLNNILVKFEPIHVQEIIDTEIIILPLLQKQNFPTEGEALQRVER